MIDEKNDTTQFLKSSGEEIYNGSLGDVVWTDENGNPIENINEHLRQKAAERLKNALKKYTPIGSVVRLKDQIGSYMIIGYKHGKAGTVYDYLAVRYPKGLTNNSPTYTFNHDEIISFSHIGFADAIHEEYKKSLLKEDGLL